MKTHHEFKEDFINRSSTGYLKKVWRLNRVMVHIKHDETDELEWDEVVTYSGTVRAYDAVSSKLLGSPQWLTWLASDFKKILDERAKEKLTQPTNIEQIKMDKLITDFNNKRKRK